MTQIIATVTQSYVLLVADRRLTFLNGPMRGQIADDDTCKLVSVCNTFGIGYTGLAQIEGVATHEWIAKTLASENCSDPRTSSQLLRERTQLALSSVSVTLRSQTFLIAGWAYFTNLTGLRPHLCAISNMIDGAGHTLSTAADKFTVLVKALRDDEDLAIHVAGKPLSWERGQRLERNLRSLIERGVSPKAALRLLVDEVIHTSTQSNIVGRKILGFCIPRKAAQGVVDSGRTPLLAAEPNENTASFCYYDPKYNEVQQFGPTMTCGGFAVTDVRTANDERQNRQSSQLKILALPKGRTQSYARNISTYKTSQVAGSIGFEFGISIDNAVAPGKTFTVPAAIKNTGILPIVFGKNLNNEVGQETPPSAQGGSVPAITFGWPVGDWAILEFVPGSRRQFAGVILQPGSLFEFDFGTVKVPNAPIGTASRTEVIDFSIRITDTVMGQLLNASGATFGFPTNVNQTLVFRIAEKSIASQLTFKPARVIDTAAGELISGPAEGAPPGVCSGVVTDTSVRAGKPGVG